ncbi:MAG: hypothetical protein JW993_08915 [Sedimentisphaerales bacterium]|nr:hypothetical protein [Sedimentisphaerales bacterium]
MRIDRTEFAAQKQELLLFVALVAAGLIAAREWVVRPHLGALRASEQYVSALKASAERSATVNSALRAKRGRLETLAAQCASRSGMVFSPAKADEFLSDLEAFCMETGCVMGGASRLDNRQDSDSGIKARTTALSLQGTCSNVIRFIQKLRARPQRVAIESLRMTAARTDSRIVECAMVITIYVQGREED